WVFLKQSSKLTFNSSHSNEGTAVVSPANIRSKERAMLLFVLRDHIGTTPLSNLAETLKKDLTNIWSSLSKPPGLESCSIDDYFDFQFTALPHKILMEDKFNEGVDALRTRFVSSTDPNYVFHPTYHKRIPA